MTKTSLPLILLTRPRAAAERFAATLQVARPELEVLISPIMEIVYIRPANLPVADVLVFTSVHGVVGYMAAGGVAAEAYCVGLATAEAARVAGCSVIAVEKDAATLGPLLAGETRRVLHPRGAHVAADLTQVASDLESVVVYDQPLVGLSDIAKVALGTERHVIVPLFSPRSAAAFAGEAEGAKALSAVFISAAAQAAARDMPCEASLVALTPDAAGMTEATLRLIDRV